MQEVPHLLPLHGLNFSVKSSHQKRHHATPTRTLGTRTLSRERLHTVTFTSSKPNPSLSLLAQIVSKCRQVPPLLKVLVKSKTWFHEKPGAVWVLYCSTFMSCVKFQVSILLFQMFRWNCWISSCGSLVRFVVISVRVSYRSPPQNVDKVGDRDNAS